ncbi:MAG: 50S ribosomal protein L18a [Archaeoglobales archaeon]|jgi:large subunit ribosomal protein LX|nr:50S ribosomal protein L18Ae [Archaeoglobi archaeon]NHW23286.1 50S ribosomal protein L18a [Archaeoglobales archaeon]TDA28139.1 MAG: 50S ribosomal protein L18a [Archaeoglobi archaeon]
MFEIKGSFKDVDGWKRFRKLIHADNEKMAIEKLMSIIGSNHKVKRCLIKVEEVKRVGE